MALGRKETKENKARKVSEFEEISSSNLFFNIFNVVRYSPHK